MQSCIKRHKVFVLLRIYVHLPNITAVLNNPTAHKRFMRLHCQCSCRKMCVWLSDRTSHAHFHLSASHCVCVICLSHRAILQLQSQRQVARSVIFDKLCWLPHFCCIWEPYTGILMDRGGNRVRATALTVTQYFTKLQQNRSDMQKDGSVALLYLNLADSSHA